MLTITNTALLEGLADPTNDGIWREFDERYRPVIVAFARKLGLNADAAEDRSQETLARFVQDYRAGKYERGRGQLRSWLFAAARSGLAGGNLPDDRELTEWFQTEWRVAILRQAFVELREISRNEPQAVRVLEMIGLEGRRPEDVAADLDISMDAVYAAKHRSLKRLRVILSQLEEVW